MRVSALLLWSAIGTVGCSSAQPVQESVAAAPSCVRAEPSLEGRWVERLREGRAIVMARSAPADVDRACGLTTMTLSADGSVAMGAYEADPPEPCPPEADEPATTTRSCKETPTTSGTWEGNASALVLRVKHANAAPACGEVTYSATIQDVLTYRIAFHGADTLVVELAASVQSAP